MMEKAKILVVDDEPTILDYLKEFLEGKGYVVTTASSGPEALKVVGRLVAGLPAIRPIPGPQ